MEGGFYRQVLQGGMSAVAYGIGTVMTRGWFWFRPAGWSVVFAANDRDEIDNAEFVKGFDSDSQQVTLPLWFTAGIGADGAVVFIRRANGFGELEKTLASSVLLIFDDSGEPIGKGGNGVMSICFQRTYSFKLKMWWLYSPIDQGVEPVEFRVFEDDGSGVIDRSKASAVVEYAGAGIYNTEFNIPPMGHRRLEVCTINSAGLVDAARTVDLKICDTTALEDVVMLSAEIC